MSGSGRNQVGEAFKSHHGPVVNELLNSFFEVKDRGQLHMMTYALKQRKFPLLALYEILYTIKYLL